MEAFKKEGIATSRQSVWGLHCHIRTYGTLTALPKSGRPTKLTNAVLETIDDAMTQDYETTTKELASVL